MQSWHVYTCKIIFYHVFIHFPLICCFSFYLLALPSIFLVTCMYNYTCIRSSSTVWHDPNHSLSEYGHWRTCFIDETENGTEKNCSLTQTHMQVCIHVHCMCMYTRYTYRCLELFEKSCNSLSAIGMHHCEIAHLWMKKLMYTCIQWPRS